MKKVNITQMATAAGVASVLAMASLASAGDKSANVTDPATLMKFEHARVINATPAQVAAAAKARTSSEGMKAYVDANGALRAPTQEELVAEAASAPAAKLAAPAAARRSVAVSTESTVIRTESGAQLEASTDADMAFAVAVIGKDGKVKQACLDHQANDQAALAAASNAVEVDSHEK